MAVAVWDPLRTTHCCSFSPPSSTPKTRKTSTSSIARSIGHRVCTSSAVPSAYYPNGGSSALVMGGGGSMCRRRRRRMSVSLAIFETMHVEPRVHCTARGGSGTLRIALVHLPDSLNLQSNGDGEGRRLTKGSGDSISRAAGRLSNDRGKNHVTLTRVTSSASDSPPPATSAEAASASDDLDTDVASSSLSSPTPPVSSAISEKEGVGVDLGLEGGLLSVEEGVLSREAEREAEKFAVVYTGDYQCRSCGYEYIEVMGDESYPIPPGMPFASLPSDWACPICGAPRTYFNPKRVEVAGFVQNQKYGLGGNSLTSGQKSLLIYGSLLFFFGVFISGYFLQ